MRDSGVELKSYKTNRRVSIASLALENIEEESSKEPGNQNAEVFEDKVTFKEVDEDADGIRQKNNTIIVPDGGWGWVVVIAAFLISACTDGLDFSFGLLHEEFSRYFDTTESKTSMIGALFIACPLLAGPVNSALVDRYGCRVMTIAAGLISSTGFLLAALSDSIGMLCLTFGFISGTAMGILYVTAVVSVAFWFDKRRNLAVSLASCGIGFGTVIYSPMTDYFLTWYDWKNTLVLLAGSLLNMCVCGALMRDPEWLIIKHKNKRKASSSRRPSSAGSISMKSFGGESLYMSAEELETILNSGNDPEHILESLAKSIQEAKKLEEITEMNAQKVYKKTISHVSLPTYIQHNEEVPAVVIEKILADKRMSNIILLNYPEIIKTSPNCVSPPNGAMGQPEKFAKTHNSTQNNLTEIKLKESATISQIPKVNSKVSSPSKLHWLTRQISVDHHYFRDIPVSKNTMMNRGAMLNRLRTASLPNITRNSTWSLESESNDKRWYHRLLALLKTTFDFRMFAEFHFLMFNLSALILSVWFIVPYFFLQSYMTSLSLEGSPTMISIIGVASSIGIVALGWAGDQPWVSLPKTYATCLIICGITVACYPLFIGNFWALSVVSAVFGLTIASSYSYIPGMLMELMPLDHFTVAYGQILLSQGLGHLVGPPIGGLLYDLTQTWSTTFYSAGAWLVVSGLCIAVIPYTKNRRLFGKGALLNDSDNNTAAV